MVAPAAFHIIPQKGDGVMFKLDSMDMEYLTTERARLDAQLEIAQEKKTRIEQSIETLGSILNVIDKIIDSTEVEY